MRGFDLRSTFHLVFLSLTKKKKLEQLGKNPQNYTAERNESFVFEQKPIEFDICNDEEEKRLRKELRKERKNNRRSLKKTRP